MFFFMFSDSFTQAHHEKRYKLHLMTIGIKTRWHPQKIETC